MSCDRLLVVLAKRLKSLMRESNLVGRIGSDEFVLILPKLNHIDEASKMGERILNLIASTIMKTCHNPYEYDN